MSADAPNARAFSAWSNPKQISKGNPGYFSDLAIDAQGVLHVIWTEGDANGVYALFYAHSRDDGATWSTPITLSGDEPTWWYRAHLKIDSTDRLHVVWEVTGDQSNEVTGITFGVTRKAVYAMIERGYLPGLVRVRRRILVRQASLLQWLQEKGAPSLRETER